MIEISHFIQIGSMIIAMILILNFIEKYLVYFNLAILMNSCILKLFFSTLNIIKN